MKQRTAVEVALEHGFALTAHPVLLKLPYGNKALVGQYLVQPERAGFAAFPQACSERINFERSKYPRRPEGRH